MRKLFVAAVLAGALCSGNASAACTQSQDQLSPNRVAMQRAILVAAMSCGDVALGSRAVFYRTGQPQQADAALLAFVLLLQARQADDTQKKASQ